MKVYYVDAFTGEAFSGNPAGVVLTKEFPEKKKMQQLAAELNLSETVFVKIPEGGSKVFATRFFTPVTEVALCGHATIAAFHVLASEALLPGSGPRFHVKQRTLQEELDVEILQNARQTEIKMTQQPPRLIETAVNLEELSRIIGLDKKQIGIAKPQGFDGNLRPTVASTGLKDLLVPVKNLEALKNIKIDEEGLKAYSRKLDIVGIHAFTLETLRDSTAHCRNFAPLVGISEEAATGTASGALGYYLVKKSTVPRDGEETRLTFEQGDFMGRPSIINCYVTIEECRYFIKVGGTAKILIRGEVLPSILGEE